jgi:hypothetical protein
MSPEVLGGRVQHEVGTVVQRTLGVWPEKRVVHNCQRALLGRRCCGRDSCSKIDVENVVARVGRSLQVHRSEVAVSDQILDLIL